MLQIFDTKIKKPLTINNNKVVSKAKKISANGDTELKPEKDATALFGPGVKPIENEIPINNNSSGCI